MPLRLHDTQLFVNPSGRQVLVFSFFVGILAWSVFMLLSPPVPSPLSDTWDYAQLARNVARGRAFESDFTYPLMLQREPMPPFHTYWRLPLYPTVCSLLWKITPNPPIQALIALSGLCFAIGAALCGRLAFRLGKAPCAWVATLLFCTSPHLLGPALEGLAEPLFIALMLGACLLLFRDNPRYDSWAGLLLGLAWLTRSNVLFFLPGILVWFATGAESWRRRFLRLLFTLALAALVCVPWWWRNAKLTGNPFFNMSAGLPWMFTEQWPGWTFFRTVGAQESAWTAETLTTLVQKGLSALWRFAVVQRVLSCNPLVLLAAIAGTWMCWKQRREHPGFWRVAIFIIVCDITTVVALSFIEPIVRLYSPMLPLLYLLAAALVGPALGGVQAVQPALPSASDFYSRGFPMRKLLTGLLLLSLVAYDLRFGLRLKNRGWQPLQPEEVALVQAKIPREGVAVSDLPDYLAWILDRPTVFLPTLRSWPAMLQMDTNVSVLHLSPNLSYFLQGEGPQESAWLSPADAPPVPGSGELLVETASGHRFYAVRRPPGVK